MKLIVGLGNPGKEYENTRHNIGFIFIDALAKDLGISITKENTDKWVTKQIEVIIKFVNFYKIHIEDILIISDDLDMDFGRIRLKASGSSGGHNGLKNIESHLKTNCFKRLKYGISNNKNIDTKDYVLSKFNKEEKEKLDNSKDEIINILKDFLEIKFDNLMNKYNKR